MKLRRIYKGAQVRHITQGRAAIAAVASGPFEPDLTFGKKNPLEMAGWTSTRAGRWLDPKSGRSYTAMEAWQVINQKC